MRPDVSVVVAAWNAAGFIAPALRSALAQDGCSLEVIVVDDASTDDTAGAVAALGDPRIRYERLAVNGGPSAARNRGFEVAAGEWIAVLDSDDDMEPGRLSRMLDLARAGGADVVVDNLTVVREGTGREEPMFDAVGLAALGRMTLGDFIGSNHLFRGEFNYGYMKPIFRAAFVRERGLAYDGGIRIGEDYTFLADVLAEGAVCVVDPTAGYRYHVRAGSISRVLALRDVHDMLRADRDFATRHSLDSAARRALAGRERSLRDGEAFIAFVDSFKKKRYLNALSHVVRRPASARHLWMPVRVRLQRMVGAESS